MVFFFVFLKLCILIWVYSIMSKFQSLIIPFMHIPELPFIPYPTHSWLNDLFLVISLNISLLACSFPSFLPIYILHFLSSIDSIFMTVSKCVSLLGKDDGRMKRHDYVEYGGGVRVTGWVMTFWRCSYLKPWKLNILDYMAKGDEGFRWNWGWLVVCLSDREIILHYLDWPKVSTRVLRYRRRKSDAAWGRLDQPLLHLKAPQARDYRWI